MLDYSQLFLSLSMVVIFIIVLAFIMQKLNAQRMGLQGPIKIHATTNVGVRERIALIQAGEVYLLVGITPQSIQALQTLTSEQAKSLIGQPQKTTKNGLVSHFFGAKA